VSFRSEGITTGLCFEQARVVIVMDGAN